MADVLADTDVDLYFADYGRGVMEAGGIVVNLPLDGDIDALVERLDGVLLTGGADIDPSRYGASPHPALGRIEPERDDHELAVYHCARRLDLPVLGICRGIQLINVAEGGTLHQHEPAHSRLDLPAESGDTHAVRFEPGSTLAELFGTERMVNSRHHQAVADVAPGLEVTALADDGIIEGIEQGTDVLAVQWHPETLPTRPTDPVFGWLVERAARRAAQR